MRIGIIGAGFIGAVHARSARLAGGELVAVAASTPQSSKQAAQRLGARRAALSAAELAEDPDIDVLHICAPNHLHVPLSRAALSTGKHVICEKPLALDVDAARELTEMSDDLDRLGAVPFVYRYYPMIREARARIAAGEAGRLRLIHGTYLQDWLARPNDTNWRVDPVLGGPSRAFADIGAHWCDLAEFVSAQRITRLAARMANFMPERPVAAGRRAFEHANSLDGGSEQTLSSPTEDAVTLQFETGAGALGSVVISQVSPGRKNRLWIEFDAAEQSFAFDQERPDSLWVGSQSGTALVPRDPAHLSPEAARVSVLPPGHPQGYADCFDAFVADSYRSIRSGETVTALPVFADGLRAAQLTDAVIASASGEGRWVDVAAASTVGAAAPTTAPVDRQGSASERSAET